VYNFFVQSYSTYKGLFYWLSWMSYISNVFFYPMAYIVMFAFLGRFVRSPESAQEYALGIATFSMSFIIMGGTTQSYSNERGLGTISFLFLSPVNRLVNFTSRLIFHYPNALLSFISALFATWLIVGLDFGSVNWSGFIVATVVTAASLAALAQLVGIFSIVLRNWMGVIALAVAVLFILTGVIIPITVFPTGVQEFTKLLPMTNGLSAIRGTFSGAPFSQVSGDILREGLTGLSYYIIAFLGFLLFEQVAKQRGTLDLESF